MLDQIQVSSQMVVVVVGSILTCFGVAVATFTAFFFRRLIQQLDRNTINNESVSRSLAAIEVRLTALEHRTATIVTQKDDH